ncbi:MAG TPA: hypothetical protein VG184_13725, partial [Acidimicrobiales bacterium]|nr:hypothetical protein [Acidimicrobiales bacterium]
LWAWGIVLVTSGGLAIGVVLAPAVSRSSPIASSTAGALGWLLFVGTSVHVAATGCLFVLPEVVAVARRNLWRSRWVPSGLILLSALVSAVVSPSGMALLLLAIFAWQFWHYQKQNLGMVSLATASHRVAALTRSERWTISSAGEAGIIGLVAHPRLLGLHVYRPLESMWVLAEVLLVASTCCGVALLASRPGLDRPAAFSVVYVLSLLFWTPMFLFESPYAAVSGMTIAHGFQYLVLVGLVLAGPSSKSRPVVRVGLALNAALLAGALLSWSSHLHSSPGPLRLLFGAYVGVLMTHFVIDGSLWRLRDSSARAFLAARVPYLVPALVVPVAGGSADGIE